ncbi:MAG: hypothetical protein AB4911_13995 [Oscillochloridaceae bacterium umkhey_bin13]
MDSQPKAGMPPVTVLLAEFAAAAVVGLVFAVAFYFIIGFALLPLQLGMGLLSIQFFAAAAGFGVGAGAGAAMVGRQFGYPGNMWLAMIAGGLTGLIVILGMSFLRLNVGGLFGMVAIAMLLALIEALVMYNLPRLQSLGK